MNFIDLFPTSILSEELNNLDTSSYQEYIQNLNLSEGSYERNGSLSMSSNILNEPIFLELKKNILNFSSLYLDELGFNYENIQISNSWVNLLNNNEQINRHSHFNSYISGCFYLAEGSPIEFYNPLHLKYIFKATYKDKLGFRGFPSYKIFPKSKMLLIFPSWLEHSALLSKEDNRISIAFNIIPKGKFGFPTAEFNI